MQRSRSTARGDRGTRSAPWASTKRIVFVCSGTICRSPMAEAIARKLLADAKIPAMVISAGTLGINSNPAATHAVTAVQELGIDLSGHRSQGVTLQLLRMADHVLVMSPEHEDVILEN